MESLIGRVVSLTKPIRDAAGKIRLVSETPRVLSVKSNLGRDLYLVEFADGNSTWLFRNEIEIT